MPPQATATVAVPKLILNGLTINAITAVIQAIAKTHQALALQSPWANTEAATKSAPLVRA